MISLLIAIASGIAVIAGAVSLGEHYLPQILEWFNNAVQEIYDLIPMFPDWLTPYILVAVSLAIISLGVKLL